MTEYIGNIVPAPVWAPESPTTTDRELKYSTVGYSQKGGRLAKGQGVLPLGTVVARRISDQLWVKYVSGGDDGAGVAAGVLRNTADTGSSGTGGVDFLSNFAFRGSLKYDLVSSANGAQLAAAVTALGAKVNQTLNVFSF